MKKQMTIQKQLFIGFTIITIFAIILGVISLVGLKTTDDSATELGEVNVLALKTLNDVLKHNGDIRSNMIKCLLGASIGADSIKNNSATAFDASVTSFNSSLNIYKDIMTKFPGEIQTSFNNLSSNATTSIDVYVALIEKVKNVKTSAEVLALMSEMQKAADAEANVQKELSYLITETNNLSIQKSIDTTSTSKSIYLIIFISLIVIVVLNVIVALFISGKIKKSLTLVINTIKSSTHNIASAAIHLTEASENLADGSSRQAASIEETSATMNESSAMISQNAENTRYAKQLADVSASSASKGMKRMEEMIIAMDELKESSDTIAKIVKVIDDIAFQTNLLAINATVEAARAGGDAGRSFAVVAEEVRILAQRSAKAASDTTDIIEKNINLTNSGREISKNVADSLSEIVKGSDDLSKIIGEVNASSEEQSKGVKQINIAISQMEKVTQQNAAVAEENAATSGNMKIETDKLQRAIVMAQAQITEANEELPPVELKTTKTVQPKSYVIKPENQPAVKSTKPASKAEKIIPLDEDDDF